MTTSLAEQVAELAAAHQNGAALVADFLASLTLTEAAALAHDWEHVWMRPKQAPPEGDWRTWGFLTGRGFGKSVANANHVVAEVQAGRAHRVALIAQNEDRCIEVMVEGESGLIACSPPWFPARFEAGRVLWTNGAQAFIYTPERPGDIFGPEHHLGWASELHAWPQSKMLDAFAGLRMGLRLGYGRLIWDSNPRRRHALIRELLEDAERDPARHVVVRGSSRENRLNLTPGVVEEWDRKYGGTQRGREMIDGEQFDDAEGSLWQQVWIDRARRDMPAKLVRRILVVDPAISKREGTDDSGLVDAGLGDDGQVYVLGDVTKRYAWEEWGELVVKRYINKRCDCVVLERNRGGDACVANLRAAAAKISRDQEIELRVEVVKNDARTRHVPGVIYAKEVIGRDSKGMRAGPVATHYEAGGVSHVNGVELTALEELLCTWDPDGGGESPNALDALVYAVLELADLSRAKPSDGKAAIDGAVKMQAALAAAPTPRAANVAAMLGGARRGDRI